MRTSRQQTSVDTGDESISLQEVSRANPFPLPESVKEKRMNAICGQKCLEQFEKYAPLGSWRRTFADLLVGTEDWFSRRCVLTWKLKDTKCSRSLFLLQVSTPRTAGNGSGLLLTPTTVMVSERSPEAMEKKRQWRESIGRKTVPPGSLAEQVGFLMRGINPVNALLPTPKSTEPEEQYWKWRERMVKSRNPKNVGKTIPNLGTLAVTGLLPTPTTANNRNSRNAILKIGSSHQNHGAALGLSQVAEIASGILPKELDSWQQVPKYYQRLLCTAIVTEERRIPNGDGNRKGKTMSELKVRIRAKLLPTPTSQDFKRRGPNSQQQGLSNVENWMRMLPTPLSGLHKTEGMKKATIEKRLEDGRQEDLNTAIYQTTGKTGLLNPLFVQEMMGFPRDWLVSPFQSGEPKV